MALTPAERETIILFDEADDNAVVTTYNVRLLNRLEKLSSERPEDVKFLRALMGGVRGGEYVVPKSWVKIRPPRILTEDQLCVMRERGMLLAQRSAHNNDQEGE